MESPDEHIAEWNKSIVAREHNTVSNFTEHDITSVHRNNRLFYACLNVYKDVSNHFLLYHNGVPGDVNSATCVYLYTHQTTGGRFGKRVGVARFDTAMRYTVDGFVGLMAFLYKLTHVELHVTDNAPFHKNTWCIVCYGNTWNAVAHHRCLPAGSAAARAIAEEDKRDRVE
jgi:hypothetical protein